MSIGYCLDISKCFTVARTARNSKSLNFMQVQTILVVHLDENISSGLGRALYLDDLTFCSLSWVGPQELSFIVHLVLGCGELISQSHFQVLCSCCNMIVVPSVVDVHSCYLHCPREFKSNPRCLVCTLCVAHTPLYCFVSVDTF